MQHFVKVKDAVSDILVYNYNHTASSICYHRIDQEGNRLGATEEQVYQLTPDFEYIVFGDVLLHYTHFQRALSYLLSE